MRKKKKQRAPNVGQDVLNIIRLYQGLTVTIYAVQNQLRERGVFVSRETVRKWLKVANCTSKDRGIYQVPTQIAQPIPEGNNEQPEPAITN